MLAGSFTKRSLNHETLSNSRRRWSSKRERARKEYVLEFEIQLAIVEEILVFAIVLFESKSERCQPPATVLIKRTTTDRSSLPRPEANCSFPKISHCSSRIRYVEYWWKIENVFIISKKSFPTLISTKEINFSPRNRFHSSFRSVKIHRDWIFANWLTSLPELYKFDKFNEGLKASLSLQTSLLHLEERSQQFLPIFQSCSNISLSRATHWIITTASTRYTAA